MICLKEGNRLLMKTYSVQGAWGCIPAYLNEIAPGSYRSLFGGLAYQVSYISYFFQGSF